MARTELGAALTAQQYRGQLTIRARALRDYMLLWPLWRGGDPSTYDQLVAATLPLIRAYHGLSGALAASYYDAFRRAEKVDGDPTPRPAPPVDPDAVATSLHFTGRIMTGRAILAGQSPQAAMQTALVRTSGSVSRFILQGGRDTLVLSSGEDRQAAGWARVTSGRACAFCAMLASRGPVFHGEDTAEFDAHDHCSCSAEPSYEGSEWPGRAREYRQLYDEHAKGDGDPLNAFRRVLEGRAG